MSGFPSKEDAAKGIFNLRAAKKIQVDADVTVFHIRSWRPGRRVLLRETYEGVKVVRLNLLRVPKLQGKLRAFNEKINAVLSFIILKRDLKKVDILHSIYITYGGVLGSYYKSKLSKVVHVTQAIGSDINSQLSDYKRNYSFSPWRKNIDGIVCNSHALEELAKPSFDYVQHFQTIYRGIDIKEKRSESNAQSSTIKVLYLGGFAAYAELRFGANTKGGLTMLEAWNYIDKDGGDSFSLTIGGPDSNGEMIQQWKQKLTHSDNVDIVGYLSPQEVKNQLEKTDILVIPSLEEGLPNLLLEGILNGVTVVATRIGGIPEVINNYKSGILVEPNEPKAIYDALENLRDGQVRRTYNQCAFETVQEKFNANDYAERINQFYQQIMDQN